MSAIRSTENRTEAELRSRLHRHGLRFRKYATDLVGKPDIVFRRSKVAVFVDGDFWHARLLRERGLRSLVRVMRTKRRDYWIAKFKRRVEIDDRVTGALGEEGWIVLRFWESDLRRDMTTALQDIEQAVRSRHFKR